MWRQAAAEAFPDAEFAEPVSGAALDSAEERLGHRLPAELRDLLLATDGIRGRHSVDTVWPLGRIVEDNLYFRTAGDFAELYMPFDPLLFIGDNGGGDQFALIRIPGRPDVFAWDHESDSRYWVAKDLRDYLARSLRATGDEWYRRD